MVVEKLPEINPPSGGVPGQVLLAIPVSESQQRWNIGVNRVTEGLSRVSVSRLNIAGRGAPGVAPPD